MIIKKAAVCAFIFLAILAAAILTNKRTHPGYQQDNKSTRVYQIQEIPWFLPREYVKIIRTSPKPLPDEP
ncbi:hypothetical protein [Paenibacillus sp. MDMC362]|uniref:hypothetical protein n=1 Tax=Paenibacillus sp. MDMC362 TaxID=2977365 RepID=UPI000DC3C833|nr:hypothetical protein [Paenibacillus sp. MDMC362]RAR40921.1 hypothetical protein DP091_26405 [Paenibacillus sp. MDMC362]